MLAIAPGTSKGARLLTIPAPVSRSASFHAHAAAYGPPPEIPRTAKRSSPRVGRRFANVVGPIDETPTGLKIRKTHARPVDGDQADTAHPGRLVAKAALDARSGPAVEVDDGRAPAIAEFRITQSTAVRELDRPIGFVCH